MSADENPKPCLAPTFYWALNYYAYLAGNRLSGDPTPPSVGEIILVQCDTPISLGFFSEQLCSVHTSLKYSLTLQVSS